MRACQFCALRTKQPRAKITTSIIYKTPAPHDYPGCGLFYGGDSVVGLCFYFVWGFWVRLLCSSYWCPFWSGKRFTGEDIAVCFTLIVLCLFVFCVSSPPCRGLVSSL